ncbi:MAG: hypothetical protein ABI565_06860 [Vicinamibacteria bacterium]
MLSKKGVSILTSTHTLEVAQEMCDCVRIILAGKIIAEGAVNELLSMAGEGHAALTQVFLKLTGRSGFQEIPDAI